MTHTNHALSGYFLYYLKPRCVSFTDLTQIVIIYDYRWWYLVNLKKLGVQQYSSRHLHHAQVTLLPPAPSPPPHAFYKQTNKQTSNQINQPINQPTNQPTTNQPTNKQTNKQTNKTRMKTNSTVT